MRVKVALSEGGPGLAAAILITARRHRKLLCYTLYATASAVSLLVAFATRFEFEIPDRRIGDLPVLAGALVVVRLIFARLFRFMTSRWRYVGVDEALRLGAASFLSSVVFLGLSRGIHVLPSVPLSVVAIEWAGFTLSVGGSWLIYRRLAEHFWARRSGSDRCHRVVLVGAGEAGNLLAHEMRRMPTPYRVVGFLDDDPLKRGTRIQGVEVLGGTDEAARLLRHVPIDEIIIAIPSAKPSDLRRMLSQMEEVDIPFRVLPGISSVIEGDPRLSDLRPLRIDDLLGRPPVSLELPELAADLRGQTVLVTGAAGSIGSELSRQIAANKPSRLLLLDQAESDLYYVDLELRRDHPDLEIYPLVGDILDEGRMGAIFSAHRPGRVLHAAAYKHVPLMERNAGEAVRNNVLGTWIIATLAGRYQSCRFVLISSDKAADPQSVMGATKRVAEMVVQGLQGQHPDTHYGAVRFGNVLGSNGSVVPLFQRQIANGGPVTITHPGVTRYFMTTPEAAQLVLQASLLSSARGQIAMLEMGEPVKIQDLARNLVRLSGLRPETDIPFVYTGLRPGEKLHETLVGKMERSAPTGLEGVRIVCTPSDLDVWRQALDFAEELRRAPRDLSDPRDVFALVRKVPGRVSGTGYRPLATEA